ncbi:MAG: acetyl-CoA carboxylase biotin carboxyl carrier protein [Bacteriovoracaceae bacterium]
MSIDLVKSFIKLAKEEGCSELNYEAKDVKIAVKFNGGMMAPIVHHAAPQQVMQAELVASKAATAKSSFHEVKSPFVGTFYASPTPTDANFCKVGDHVKKGQVLCILEAMKIMNEIEADAAGEIVEICIENESLVEYAQVLFRIKA